MNRKHLVTLIALLLALLVVAIATAAPAAAIPIEPNNPEWEPNNDLDSANRIENDVQYHGRISTAGDVDFYYFSEGYSYDAGRTVRIDFFKPETSPLKAALALYDGNRNLVAQATCTGNGPCLQYTFAREGRPFLSVSDADGKGGAAYEYRILQTFVTTPPSYDDPNEPNDFPSQATPMFYGEVKKGAVDPCGDVDYFTFNGKQEDELLLTSTDYWVRLLLLDAGLNIIGQDNGYTQRAVLPEDGTYYLLLYTSEGYCNNEDRSYEVQIDLTNRPIYLSFNKGGKVQGIPFTAGDVLTYWTKTGQWEMFLDMSDLGLTGNLTAFAISYDSWECIDYGDVYLLGFAGAYQLPGMGTVTPQDLIWLSPSSTGPLTSGRLGWAFDGSDVGLTTTAERIDAVGSYWSSWWPISTVGKAQVPYGIGQMQVPDEDAVVFYAEGDWNCNFTPDTAGTWHPDFDGSLYGLGAADIVGTDYEADYQSQTYHRWFAFDRAVTFGGITFAPGDIADCVTDYYDSDAECHYVTKVLDISDAGLVGYKVDALEVGYPED